MLMKNPCHPGELIKSDLEELQIPIMQAAKALGVSRQQLRSVIAGPV